MARKEFRPGTVFCAPELLRKGVGVSPVNGGPGGNELEPEGPCPDGDVSLPRRRFASFAAAGKGGRPAGRNPSHGTKPFRKTAGGSETRPYNISGRSPQNGTTGGASPSPTGKRKTSRRGGTGAQCAPLPVFCVRCPQRKCSHFKFAIHHYTGCGLMEHLQGCAHCGNLCRW